MFVCNKEEVDNSFVSLNVTIFGKKILKHDFFVVHNIKKNRESII